MTYTPLLAILLLLVFGAAVTLAVLFRAERTGHFDNLKAGAYVIFDESEPVGETQDQLFRRRSTQKQANDAPPPPDAPPDQRNGQS